MADDRDPLLVSYREHVAMRDELKGKLQELELQYARLSASLMHLPEKVDDLTKAVNQLTQLVASGGHKQQSQDQDHATLALHRAIDQLSKNSGGPGLERWLLLALIGGAGWMAARFFIGG